MSCVSYHIDIRVMLCYNLFNDIDVINRFGGVSMKDIVLTKRLYCEDEDLCMDTINEIYTFFKDLPINVTVECHTLSSGIVIFVHLLKK